MKISFFKEDIKCILPGKKTKDWIKTIVSKKGFTIKDLNFILCSDEYLHGINLEYLNHDTYTDIITFDNSEEKGILEGDIFISLERIKENAIQYKSTTEEELHRVIVHGVLHLMGYKDKTKEEKILMRNKEDECLSLRQK